MNENGGELSGKYCSKLGTNVMVLKTVTENGEQRRCLSSHLCRVGAVGAVNLGAAACGHKRKNLVAGPRVAAFGKLKIYGV